MVTIEAFQVPLLREGGGGVCAKIAAAVNSSVATTVLSTAISAQGVGLPLCICFLLFPLSGPINLELFSQQHESFNRGEIPSLCPRTAYSRVLRALAYEGKEYRFESTHS